MPEIELDEEARARVAAWKAADHVFTYAGGKDKTPRKPHITTTTQADREATNRYWAEVERNGDTGPATVAQDDDGLSWMNKG